MTNNVAFKSIHKYLPCCVVFITCSLAVIYLSILAWSTYFGPFTTALIKKNAEYLSTRVVISLTTTPQRIKHLRTTLDSIRKQSLPVDRIYVNIPYTFKRENIPYKISSWLAQYPDITIVRSQDYGPITKLIPTLQLEQDPNTIIITLDDDLYYSQHIVRDLVQRSLDTVNAAITPISIGFNITMDSSFTYQLSDLERYQQDNYPSLLVIGAAGVAYKRKFFKYDFFDFTQNLPLSCFTSDDFVISSYLHANNVDILQIASSSFNPLIISFAYKELPHGDQAGALKFSNHQKNYSKCLTELPLYGKKRYQYSMIQKSLKYRPPLLVYRNEVIL